MNFPDKYQVDHINLNKLDNRRDNLRMCTPAENLRNVGARNRHSNYKGVRFYKNRWVAEIGINYQHVYLGRFKLEEEAAKAYDKAARELHGEFARTNFQEDDMQHDTDRHTPERAAEIALEAEPPAIYACIGAPMEEFIPGVIADAGPGMYPCPCTAFVRTPAHDLRPPRAALVADAWTCGAQHVFWVDPGYVPLSCPRCEGPSVLISAGPAVCAQCGAPADPGAALSPELPLCAACGAGVAHRLLCVIFSAGPRCPECAEPVGRAGMWCSDCACTVCAGSHRPTQCPEIAAEWRRQVQLARWGETMWYLYQHHRDLLVSSLRASPTMHAARAEALALYLEDRTGLAPQIDRVVWHLRRLEQNEAAA
jgi:hypothetical protein